jgi:hypothetical protein
MADSDMADSDENQAMVEETLSVDRTAPRRRRGPWVLLGGSILGSAVFAGWWAHSAHQQQQVVAAVRALGGTLKYRDQLPFERLSPPARWLKDWPGHDWAAPVAQVNLSGANLGADELVEISKLGGLQFLWLNGAHVDDGGLAYLARLSHLEELYLADNPLTDAGLAHLADLERLRFLSLAGTNVSDEGLKQLSGLKQLVRLDLPGTKVTNAGVAELQKALTTTKIVYSQAGHGLRASSVDATGQQQDVVVQAHKKP